MILIWRYRYISALRKNSKSYVEKQSEATSHETTAIWPPTSINEKHPNSTKMTYGTLLEKQGRAYVIFINGPLHMDAPVQVDKKERTCNYSLLIEDVAGKTGR